jgi:hypothetical protein
MVAGFRVRAFGAPRHDRWSFSAASVTLGLVPGIHVF